MTGKTLTIAKRATKRETDTATIRRWTTNTEMVLSHVKSKFGLPDEWLVIRVLDERGERIESRHRKEGPARAELARLAKLVL